MTKRTLKYMAFLLKNSQGNKIYIELRTNAVAESLCKRSTGYTMMQWLMTSGEVSDLVNLFESKDGVSQAESLLVHLAMGHKATIDSYDDLLELISLSGEFNLELFIGDLKGIPSDSVFPMAFTLEEVTYRDAD